MSRLLTSLILASALAFAAGCGGDDDPDAAHVMFTGAPPASATAATAFDVMWEIHTEGDLHHSEIRVCDGADIGDCGMGDLGTFTSVTGSMTNGVFTASVTLDAGDYTVVAWAHVGETPHVSDDYNVNVQ
jgi:hypothetical protein